MAHRQSETPSNGHDHPSDYDYVSVPLPEEAPPGHPNDEMTPRQPSPPISSSPPHVTAASPPLTEPRPQLRVGEHEAETDQQLSSLKGMFPDFDNAAIRTVLDSVNNDHERALEVLLSMNDPTYVPTASATASTWPDAQQPPALSQQALDEQLARRLAFEEGQAASVSPYGPGQQWYQQPYVQRYNTRGTGNWGGWGGSQVQTPQGGQRDTMTELQEGFSKIAESGKRTFSSIVSKVKAKMQDLDQGGTRSSDSRNTGPDGTYEPGQSSYPYAPVRPSPANHAQVYTAPPIPVADTRPKARTPTPPARGYDVDDTTIEVGSSTTPRAPPSGTNGGESLGPAKTSLSDNSSVPPTSQSYVLPGAFPAPDDTSTTANTASGLKSQPPPSRSSLGLLPKRPVSLVNPRPVPSEGTRLATVGKSESEEDLEYVENPFDDRHHK